MKNLRVLFWLVVVAAAAHTGWKVVPAYIANFRLAEVIDDSARSATVSTSRSEDEIRSLIFREAHDLQIPLRMEDIKVERNGADVLVSADYVVHVDVPVYPFDLEFHPSSKRGALTFH